MKKLSENENQQDFNRKSSLSSLLFMLLFYLLIGVLSVFADLRLNHNNYGFPQLKWWVISISTGLLISCVNILISIFTPVGRRLNKLIRDMTADYATAWFFALVVVGAISEELLFRALGLGWMVPMAGPVLAIVFTSVIFGFLHGFFRPPFVLWSFTALVWGLVLGFLMVESGFILVPVTVHATINLLGAAWLRYGSSGHGV